MKTAYGAVRLRAKKNRIALIPYTSLAVPLAALIREAESLAARGRSGCLRAAISVQAHGTIGNKLM